MGRLGRSASSSRVRSSGVSGSSSSATLAQREAVAGADSAAGKR